jgi:diaminohydroxyphosphoribosylaminopyrimidine deaminase/5-amino-6-(5-phosphoribosylamino)uracil reductase
MDAIIVGIGTALADDPQLTARPPGPRKATRIVLDSRGQLSATSKLVQGIAEAPLLIVGSSRLDPGREAELRAAGAEVLNVAEEKGRPSVPVLLDELGRRRMTNVLVEGGAAVLGSFLDAGAIDEVHIFLAPRLVGGAGAKSPIAGRGVERIAEGLSFAHWELERIDSDVLWHGWR